jgi:hypothetical protein
MIIVANDSEDRLRAVVPEILPMVKEGLVALLDAAVFAPGTQSDVPLGFGVTHV